MADMSLQHPMEIMDSSPRLADWDGGPMTYEGWVPTIGGSRSSASLDRFILGVQGSGLPDKGPELLAVISN